LDAGDCPSLGLTGINGDPLKLSPVDRLHLPYLIKLGLLEIADEAPALTEEDGDT
jgi:hypothetical protein